MSFEEDEELPLPAVPVVNEIQAENGTRLLFQSSLSRGHRQFDLTIHMQKWEAPETVASYLRIYAEMLVKRTALVNNIESLEN